MRGILLVTVLTALAFILPASLAQQAEPPIVLRVVGNEGPGCGTPSASDLPPNLLCFQPEEDPATVFVAGETVRVELTAAGDAPHNINVILEDDADSNHVNTETTDAIATSDTTGDVDTVYLTFTVPATGTLYFWCDVSLPFVGGTVPVGDHELGGMYFTADVQPATTGNNTGNETGGNTTTGNETGGNTTTGNETGGNTTTDGSASDGTTDGTNTTDDGADDGNATDDAVDEEESPGFGLVAVVAGIGGIAAYARRRTRST